MKLYMIIIIFILLGAFFIISENNLALSKPGSFEKFVNLYLSWLDSLFSNARYLGGYVVKLDWLPKNVSG